MDNAHSTEDNDSDLTLPSHYIGIGASAGGLEALQKLLQNLPTDTGACFIIVQHLSPDFKSMMLELLSKHTSMKIINVTDGIAVKPNTIYLIPPKKNMIVAKGQLLLSDKIPDSGPSLPIDIFFRSLSEDQQHKAIGIILSGTGSDGSRGIKALKEAGALAIAQDPESAKFDGMPNSAINTGIVDLILRPEEVGEKLATYIQHPFVQGETHVLKSTAEQHKDSMAEIFSALKMRSEIDFSKYKPSTVARRIERRMTIKQINSLQEYLALLFKDPHEIDILSKELLIGVTRFFRDEEAFDVLKTTIIPELIKYSVEDNPIRIWVAACSTGEEAYSIAILFHEELARQNLKRTIKIFATDVNSDSIAEASNGIYNTDIAHDLDSNNYYLSAYFTKIAGNAYEINKNIRQSVIFATHNMIIDSPFSNMDLVTCRNTLIYFQHSIQKRVLTSLHFALRKDGYLFLGSSENLGDIASHFTVINDRARIYQKRSNIRIPMAAPPQTSNTSHATAVSAQNIPPVDHLMRNYRGGGVSHSAIGFANENLITYYAPPCILLNEEHQALHVYGDVSPYVRRLPPGRISYNIKDIVNDDISIAISSALSRAKNTDEEVYYTNVLTGQGEQKIALNLLVRHIREQKNESAPGYYWIIFEDIEGTSHINPKHSISFDESEHARRRIEDLETELKRSKESLQVTVEELETTNEELQSANEELMSANEELQSTNEELQSVNQELYTVNSEYQEKIAEISQANNDLDEVLILSKIGIIFLDENLLIRRYTHAASSYVNLIDGDINRPLHHISLKIQYHDLLSDVSLVLNSGIANEREITLDDKRVIRVTILPYRYANTEKSKGIAITFTDITHMKYIEMGMAVSYQKLRNSINNTLKALDTQPFDKKIRILVVSEIADELEIMSVRIQSIAAFDTHIDTASNCPEALSMAHLNAYDACIADYHLGSETAIDLISRFEKNDFNCPIIVMTEDEPKHLKPLLLSHGILDIIEKNTISPEHIAQSIRFAIRRKQIDDHIDAILQDEHIVGD